MGKGEEFDPLLMSAAKLAYQPVDGATPTKGDGGWKEMLGPLFTAILCFPMLLAH